jgi:hypothetical protein
VGHRSRIATDVEDAAASELVNQKVVGRARAGVIAEDRVDQSHSADGAVPQQIQQATGLRVAPVRERLAGEAAVAAAAATICEASPSVTAIGFSHSTCLPDSAARTAHSRCQGWWVAT